MPSIVDVKATVIGHPEMIADRLERGGHTPDWLEGRWYWESVPAPS